MTKHEYANFGELDAAAGEEFKTDIFSLMEEVDRILDVGVDPQQDEDSDSEQYPELPELADEADEDTDDPAADTSEELKEIGLATVYSAFRLWTQIWHQTAALIEAGVEPLPEEPFGGTSALRLARELATKALGSIPPLPDEVAAPIMAAAYRFIGPPADDVIALQHIYLEQRAEFRSRSDGTGRRSLNAQLEAFSFAKLPGEAAPWRGPIRPIASTNLRKRGVDYGYAQVLRSLIISIRDAAVIVLQSLAGSRINEICGLRAEAVAPTGFPSCVEVRRSESELFELFYLRGTLSKSLRAPAAATWLIGSRPSGSDWTPAAVRAVEVLQRLLKPWRSMATDKLLQQSLIISFKNGWGLPLSGGTIGPITGTLLLRGQKDFVRKYVDLDRLSTTSARGENLAKYRDSEGTCISTHQWRKTFALYVFRTNNRLLPAISQQFKHLSLAMTERAYVGNDPTLLRDLDSTAVQESVRFWAQLTECPGTNVAGRMGAIIAKHRAEIDRVVDGLEGERKHQAIEAWVLSHDLRIFHNPEGKCLIRLNPTAARCHELSGTTDWKNKSPSYKSRDTTVCLGCNLFAIDGEHVEFWLKRYEHHQAAWLSALQLGDTRGFRAVKGRADQSAAVLRALGAQLPKLEILHAL